MNVNLDKASFINPQFHGSMHKVEESQDFLYKNCRQLSGESIVLTKRLISKEPKRVVYDIIVPNDTNRIIGCTSQQLTLDIARCKGNFPGPLPNTINGLRISQVITITMEEELPGSIPEPWRLSRIWFGIDIHGIGSFRFGD